MYSATIDSSVHTVHIYHKNYMINKYTLIVL